MTSIHISVRCEIIKTMDLIQQLMVDGVYSVVILVSHVGCHSG